MSSKKFYHSLSVTEDVDKGMYICKYNNAYPKAQQPGFTNKEPMKLNIHGSVHRSMTQ